MKIVVDTNCLLASIPPKSDYYWLYEAFRDEKFDWVVSNEVINEYEELLAQKYSQNTAKFGVKYSCYCPKHHICRTFLSLASYHNRCR
jgi:predicted nucleic acid-binding protein